MPRAREMIANTAPFDISHHPAMAIPCGTGDGLPVSMMLVGKHLDEPTIYRAAAAFEQAGDWKRCRDDARARGRRGRPPRPEATLVERFRQASLAARRTSR